MTRDENSIYIVTGNKNKFQEVFEIFKSKKLLFDLSHKDIKSTGADSTHLKVNGQTIRSGEIIDENNIVLENVNSISFNAYRWLEMFTSRVYYFKLVPIDMGADLEFDCTIKLGNLRPDDTLNNLELYYNYKTDHNQLVSLKLWNYGTSNWDIIDDNIYPEFTDHCNSIPNNYYNHNYEIKIKFEGLDDDTQFHLFIDQLVVSYDWTKTSGNIYSSISKALSYDFLNRYDSGYPNYQNLYNITLTFDYKFIDSLSFPTYSAFSCEDNSFNLVKDGNWHIFSYTFDFNSQVLNEFNINFNISNGYLELNNMNYDIRFKCLNPSGKIILQQSFYLECLNSQDLSNYSQLYLNITYDLNTINDYYDYYNTFGRKNKLEIKYEIKADGIWKSFIYSVNNSECKQSNFDITQFMLDNGLNNFEDFRITFTIIGENTELTVSNIMLYGYD